MTTKHTLRPFIASLATPIEHAEREILRYDQARQVSEVLVGEMWVDASANGTTPAGGTRMTKVAQETTDDA
jgi:hypothetical protein